MRIGIPWLVCASLVHSPLLAQDGPSSPAETPQPEAPEATPQEPDEPTTEKVSLRISQLRPGGVVLIDRGVDDGLAVGDRVVFYPPGTRAQAGRIRVADARSAEVQLDNRGALLQRGTRGFAQVPVERFGAEAGGEAVAGAIPPAAAEHPPWQNEDQEWEEDMPLLTSIDGVRPEERAPIMSGRLYSLGNVRQTSDDKRSDMFIRAGTELNWDNPMGKGGQLHFEGELNYRETFVNDQVDESTSRGRLDWLSYSWGGTRFQTNRHEAGRFLHYGVPELGLIDGYEWNKRMENGHRAGASFGYLPEPTPELSTGDDMSVSAFYQWAADQREQVTATGAYQKTWHNGNADRDLFVLKFDYWADEGWDLHSTAWIDWYTSGDVGKSSGPEFTRVYASSSKQWESGDGATFTFVHNAFPSIDRFEYLPVNLNQLYEDHNERLGVDGWTWLSPRRRLHGRVGGWVDQEDAGGDGEVGLEQLDIFVEDSRADLTVYTTFGKFSTNYGVRARYGIQRDQMHWNASYVYFQSDQLGFASNNDNLDHHRVLGSMDYSGTNGWSVSLTGGLELWSEEVAVVLGFYIQRSF